MTDFDFDKWPEIDFPHCGNSTAWKKVDDELRIALPAVFTQEFIDRQSTSEVSKKLDLWLYEFFKERFGLKPVSDGSSPTSEKKFRHRGLERLRKQKRELRAAIRHLVKAGKGDSEAAQLLKTKRTAVTKAQRCCSHYK